MSELWFVYKVIKSHVKLRMKSDAQRVDCQTYKQCVCYALRSIANKSNK